ncbi:MAG: transcription termination/antitermination protein NusG [Eubacteriales bacterium]|nr:transcription termination/antitermination protein NusG [Eubacteriales bacterium]MDY2826963.1 transcription termination/antitermination protein NusG [Eubacteriales bacterium]
MSNINEMNVGPRWYVAHTYSGYENKVKTNLEKVIANRGLGDMIFDIRIPVETVVEKKGDVEKTVELKVFPSYVYIKMVMNDETWHAVRNIIGVTGFVGPGSRPTPISEEEVRALHLEDAPDAEAEEVRVSLSFAVGDSVKVVSGLFEGYTGTVEAISEDQSMVTVLIKRGRRDMPVELGTECVVPENA